MSLLIPLLILSSSFQFLHGCMPSTPGTTTTTKPFLCCPVLTSNSLLKIPPVLNANGQILEQCSILRRISSNCGDEAFLLCEAAPFTNPTTVFLQYFDANGNKVNEIQGNAQQATGELICNHDTGVYHDGEGDLVSRVSCAQLASTGANAPDDIFT